MNSGICAVTVVTGKVESGAKSCVACHGDKGQGPISVISQGYLAGDSSYEMLVQKIELDMPNAQNPLQAPESEWVATFIQEAMGNFSTASHSRNEHTLSNSW